MATFGGTSVGYTYATGSDPGGFISTKWIDDVIVTYKSNIVLPERVKKIPFQGQKGDQLFLPSLTTRGNASAKAENTLVTLVTRTDSEVSINLNKHYEYSFVIEDRVSIQAMDSLLVQYMEDAGYALAKQIDQDLWVAFSTMQGGTQFSGSVIGSDGSTAWSGTANSNAGNAAALSDAGIRRIIQTLDDSDNPLTDRHLVVPPVERNNIMGIARYSEQAFIGNGTTIRNGTIANLYGVDVAVSVHCPYVHTDSGDGDDYFDFSSSAATTGTDITGTSVTIGAGGTARGRVAAMFHRNSVALVEQLDVRMQSSYKQEYLGNLHTADCLYGTAEVRDYGAVTIIVDN
jgi:hypothetical protein